MTNLASLSLSPTYQFSKRPARTLELIARAGVVGDAR